LTQVTHTEVAKQQQYEYVQGTLSLYICRW